MVADAQRAEQGEHQGSFLTDLDKMDADRFRGSFSGDEKDVFFINDEGGFFDAHALLGFDDVLDGRAVVPIDVNGDGRVNVADLLLTLGAFGANACDGSSLAEGVAAADFNADCQVNVEDLLLNLGAFGQTCEDAGRRL